MAIENELKYILRPEAFKAAMEKGEVRKIEQHYLGDGLRMRRDTANGETSITFTFKRRVASGLVEIETHISDTDYALLFPTVTHGISKQRISFTSGDEHWDVDLFETSAGSFVMAEVEMPDGQLAPKWIPEFVSENLILPVGTDLEWSNAAMAQPGALEKAALRINHLIELLA